MSLATSSTVGATTRFPHGSLNALWRCVGQRRAGCFPFFLEGLSFNSRWKKAFVCGLDFGVGLSRRWRHIGQTFLVSSVCMAWWRHCAQNMWPAMIVSTKESIQTGQVWQARSDGRTTTCYCEVGGCVHANDTLKRGELDTAVLDGLEEVFRHPIVGLGQVVELNPTRVTVSIEKAVAVVVIGLYCNSRWYRRMFSGGCRSRGVPRTSRCGGPARSSCTGPLGCRRANLMLFG